MIVDKWKSGEDQPKVEEVNVMFLPKRASFTCWRTSIIDTYNNAIPTLPPPARLVLLVIRYICPYDASMWEKPAFCPGLTSAQTLHLK